jgi:uncharacterized repeat protein (TIGR04138 family)
LIFGAIAEKPQVSISCEEVKTYDSEVVVNAKILEAVRENRKYAYEAYEFICTAVTYTQDRLGRNPKNNEDDSLETHISALELLKGTCEFATREFGMMAGVVFKQWGIETTLDIGQIVFSLIKVERLSQSEQDDIEDFRDVFDLKKELSITYTPPTKTANNRKWDNR